MQQTQKDRGFSVSPRFRPQTAPSTPAPVSPGAGGEWGQPRSRWPNPVYEQPKPPVKKPPKGNVTPAIGQVTFPSLYCWATGAAELRYQRLAMPPIVHVQQPGCVAYEGRVLGAMLYSGAVHHYRVETQAGELYLVPPSWLLGLPPYLPSDVEVVA